MTAYAAIQNPTNWNVYKKMHEGMEKRKAKSRDNNKLQKPTSAHWHIK